MFQHNETNQGRFIETLNRELSEEIKDFERREQFEQQVMQVSRKPAQSTNNHRNAQTIFQQAPTLATSTSS